MAPARQDSLLCFRVGGSLFPDPLKLIIWGDSDGEAQRQPFDWRMLASQFPQIEAARAAAAALDDDGSHGRIGDRDDGVVGLHRPSPAVRSSRRSRRSSSSQRASLADWLADLSRPASPPQQPVREEEGATSDADREAVREAERQRWLRFQADAHAQASRERSILLGARREAARRRHERAAKGKPTDSPTVIHLH